MKEHKKFERLMEKALYGELSDTESVLLDEHLNSCAQCKYEFDEFKNTLNFFKPGSEREPNEIFMDTFWNSLDSKIKQNTLHKKQSVLESFWNDIKYTINYGSKWKYQLAGGNGF